MNDLCFIVGELFHCGQPARLLTLCLPVLSKWPKVVWYVFLLEFVLGPHQALDSGTMADRLVKQHNY